MNIGDVIGTRTAVERNWRNKRWCWLMRCQCGFENWAREYDLTHGYGLICQKCLAKENAKRRHAKA